MIGCSGDGRSSGASGGANSASGCGGVGVDVSVGSSSSLSPPKSSSGSSVGATMELGGVRLTGDVALYLARLGKTCSSNSARSQTTYF